MELWKPNLSKEVVRNAYYYLMDYKATWFLTGHRVCTESYHIAWSAHSIFKFCPL